MDIVYINKYGTNEELRYSLRSLDNINHDNVFVVGGKPNWYTGSYIPVPFNGHKYSHARANLHKVVKSDKISEDFILMNDDFYIVKPIGDLKVYHQGLLKDKVDTYLSFAPKSHYTKMLIATYEYLVAQGCKKPLCYDLHVPMVMNKQKLKEALDTNLLWRSIYGNLNKIGGTKMDDVKVYSDKGVERIKYDYLNSKSPFLSSQDNTFPILKEMLKELYPNQSKYEAVVKVYNRKIDIR
jgi:hypothetical protein